MFFKCPCVVNRRQKVTSRIRNSALFPDDCVRRTRGNDTNASRHLGLQFGEDVVVGKALLYFMSSISP